MPVNHPPDGAAGTFHEMVRPLAMVGLDQAWKVLKNYDWRLGLEGELQREA